MNDELRTLIQKYQKTVNILFPKVAEYLEVTLPISNIDWTYINADQLGETTCGIKYIIHGYGIVMNDGKMKVDFDLGEKGQINGFDAWRLEAFVKDNNIETKLDNGKAIELEIKKAESNGDVVFSGYILYYMKSDF